MLTPSRSESYHTASESRTSPWYTDSVERSSVDFDSSDAESPFKQVSKELSSNNDLAHRHEREDVDYPPILNKLGFESKPSADEEEQDEARGLSPILENSIMPNDSQLELNNYDSKIYTIFESPNSTPSQNEGDNFDDENAKKSDMNNNLPEISGLSYYYQNIITKQIIKTCL